MKFLIFLAILPGIVIGFLIYKADRLEKEPKKELLKAFLTGIVAVIITLILSFMFGVTKVDINFKNWIEIFAYSFLGISLIEEFSKWICSYFYLKNNKNYDYLFDGVVYTTFVSLGFATIENLLYTLSSGFLTGVARAVTTVPVHTFFGVFSGYYLSLSRKEQISSNKQNKTLCLLYSLLIPFLLHGFYDFCLLMQNIILFIVYLIFVIFLYSISIYQIKKLRDMDAPIYKKKD